MTSSARASSVGGTLRPSILAARPSADWLWRKPITGHRRLLRACRERPRGRRAADERDEVAPLHGSNPGIGSRETIARWEGASVLDRRDRGRAYRRYWVPTAPAALRMGVQRATSRLTRSFECGGRAPGSLGDIASEIEQALSCRLVVERLRERVAELRHDLLGRAFGREQRIPGAHFKFRKPTLLGGRDIRQAGDRCAVAMP